MDNICTLKKFGVLGMPNVLWRRIGYWGLNRIDRIRSLTFRYTVFTLHEAYMEIVSSGAMQIVRMVTGWNRCWTAVRRPRIRHESWVLLWDFKAYRRTSLTNKNFAEQFIIKGKHTNNIHGNGDANTVFIQASSTGRLPSNIAMNVKLAIHLQDAFVQRN
jgi:hypothetical protein